MIIAIIIIILLLAINAFYVAGEYAVVSVGRHRARKLARELRPGGRLLHATVTSPRNLDHTITACQVGISASSMLLGAYSQMVLSPLLLPFAENWLGLGAVAARSMAVGVVLTVITCLQMVLGEQVPKTMAVRSPGRWSLVTILPLRLSRTILAPFILVLSGAANLILWLLRVPLLPEHSLHSPAEISSLVAQSALGGVVQRDLSDRLRNALRLASRTAGDIMVPRLRMAAVPENITLEELRQRIHQSGHTRLPVYRGSLDTIIGVIHAKDVLLRTSRPGLPVEPVALMRPIPFFPWSTRAVALLESMRAEHAAMALVMDEHGGTAGLVTLEDLLEEVMGEMEDEFDAQGPPVGRLEDGRLRLRAEDTIAWANSHFGMQLHSEQARTVGGLIMEALRRAPSPGDEVKVAGYRLKVERVKGKRVQTILAEPAGSREDAP